MTHHLQVTNVLPATVLTGLLLLLGFSISRTHACQLTSLHELPSAVKESDGWVLLLVGGWLLVTALWAVAFSAWLLG